MNLLHFPTLTLPGLLLCGGGPVTEHTAPATPRDARVDLAICLDTSGSMNGLIDSARQGIWAIVNDFALAKPAPKLRVALLTYGNDGHNKENGWVEVQTAFTEDLDLVSQKLFALTTNGGTELVGRVVQTSLDRLEWTTAQSALKLIVVAGNESADQDQECSFRDACRRAIGAGVMINSIYCGDPNDQLAPAWREVAQLADGKFHAIDKDNGAVAIETPFDAQIQALNAQVNKTYVPYGAEGKRAWANQEAQDRNASGLNSQVAAERAMCKTTGSYDNSQWDLLDACRAQKVKLSELKPEDLPEALRGKTPAELEKHVATLQAERDGLHQKIQDLSAKRQKAVEEEMAKRALDPTKSFDYAVRQAVRAQAEAKGIAVRAAAPVPTGDTVQTSETVKTEEAAKSTGK